VAPVRTLLGLGQGQRQLADLTGGHHGRRRRPDTTIDALQSLLATGVAITARHLGLTARFSTRLAGAVESQFPGR
jgi:hypothetical protein